MGTWHDGYSIYKDDDGTYFATQDIEGPISADLGWLQPHTYGDSPVQQISNPGGVLAPALLAGGAYYAGKHDLINRTANALNRPRRSVAMEGPMRFAGRGIPEPDKGYHKDYPGLPGLRPPLAAEPYIPPAHIGRHPPDSTMIVPEVVYPEAATEIGQEVIGVDTRSEWEKWKDSFKEDWRAK